jgi:hypothetical protein
MMLDRVGDLHVGDDQEPVEQPALAIEQREVFLVLLHGQNQAFLRHFEVFGFELADINHRPFDQRRHLVEQAVGRMDAGSKLAGSGVELCGDGCPPFREVDDDLARSQLGDILVRMVDDDLAARQEAMALRRPAALQPEDFSGNDVLAVQEDQAMHGANELVFGISPVHQFRDRQFPERLGNDVGQMPREFLALFLAPGDKVLALAVGRRRELFETHAGRAHEAFECLGRFAGGVEPTGNAGALLLQHAVRLAGSDSGDGQRQAARGGVGGAVAVRGRELLRPERRKNGFGEGFGQRLE